MVSVNDTGSSAGSAGSEATATVTVPTTSTTAPPDPTYTVAPKLDPYNAADTCAWYEQSQCYMPRSCYDCINVALRRDDCAVDPSGVCVSMINYRQSIAAHGNASGSGFDGYYPAANYTYCSIYDDTCKACKNKWSQEYATTGLAPTTEMCRGADGCICISSCEMPNRREAIISARCSVVGMVGPPSKLVMSMYLGAAVIGVLLLVLLMFKAWEAKKRDEARAEARRERRRNRPEPTGPQLSLAGWNDLRAKLLETEREFIEGDKPTLGQLGGGGGAVAVEVAATGDEARYDEQRVDEDGRHPNEVRS